MVKKNLKFKIQISKQKQVLKRIENGKWRMETSD